MICQSPFVFNGFSITDGTTSQQATKTARRKARTIPDGSGRQTPSNGLTVTDTTIEPARIVVNYWFNDFRNGGSEPEHKSHKNEINFTSRHSVICFRQ
jgi:hypothetical protein